MKRFFLTATLLLLSTFSAGQVANSSQTATSSGSVLPFINTYGGLNATFEEIPSGSPATVSVTIQGCMKGNTCDAAADTNSSTSAAIRGVTFTKVYTWFKVTTTWTGGTSPTITVNNTITTARGAGGGGGGSVSSVFGRTGDVVANANDYAFNQLSGNIAVSQIANGVNADGTHFLRGDNTWQTITGSPCTTTALSIQFNSAGAFGCVTDLTYNTHTITLAAAGILDTSAASPTAGLKIPTAAGAVPTADGFVADNSTNHTHVFGSNGQTLVTAVATTGTGTATTCTNQVVTVISGIAIPTCTTLVSSFLPATVVYNNSANTFGASGTLDLSGTSTSGGLKLPIGAGAAPTVDGLSAFDSTLHIPVWGNNGATLTIPSNFVNDTNVTLTPSANNRTLTAGWSGTLAKARIIASAVFNDQSNTFSTGTQDFSAATLFKVRVGAGLTASANGDIGYDTTNKNYHAFQNSVDALLFSGPAGATYTNNDCVKFGVSAGVVTLVDAGSGCAGSASINNATQYSGAYYSASGSAATISGVAAPTTPSDVPQYWVSSNSGGAAAAPAWTLAGISGRAVAGTTDTILVTDRSRWITYSSGSAVAVTLAQAGSTGFATNFVYGFKATGAGSITVTPTTSTIDGNATLVVTQGQNCTIASLDNTNYVSRCAPGQVSAGTNIAFTPSANGLSIDVGSNVVLKSAANTGAAAMTFDMSASTSSAAFRLPNIAGASSTTSGTASYDTTNKMPHFGANSVDNVMVLLPSSISPANNDCMKFSVISGVITINTAGAACGTGGTPALDAVTNLTASKTFANGNFTFAMNDATTTPSQVSVSFGETTAASGSSDVHHSISTLNNSTATLLQLTQGASGPSGANAPPVLNVSVAAAGGAASGATAAGNNGSAIALLTGAGSAGGATSGNGGIGGTFSLTLGIGGGVSGASNNGGNGGTYSITTGAGAAGGASGTSGNGGNATFTMGVGGTVGTAGSVGQFLITSSAPASVSTATGASVGTMFRVAGVAGGASSNAAGTAGIGSLIALNSGNGGAGTGTNAVGGAGGSFTLTAGDGGASSGSGANSNGGSLTLTPGVAGTGGAGAAGTPGIVQVAGNFRMGTSAGDFNYVTHTLTMGSSGLFDLSAGGANSFKMPVIAGCTSGANGVACYDSTNNITHLRTNSADSLAAATTSTSTTTTQMLFVTAVAGVYNPRAAVPGDIPTLNQNTTGTASNLSGTPALPNGTTATTQTPKDGSGKLSTTAYADAVTSFALGSSGTITSGKLACVTASNTQGNCTALPPANVIGVFNTSTTYLTVGITPVTLDATVNVTFGDFLCSSATLVGTAHDNGTTPCTTGQYVGIVTTTAASVSSATASLRLQ